MTNFTDGETLLAADLNAAFAGLTPPSSDLLGGSGTAFTQITVGSGLVLSGGTLEASGIGLVVGPGLVSSGGTLEVQAGTGLSFSGNTLIATGGAGSVTSIVAGAGLTGGTITTAGTITVAYAATGTPTTRTQPDRAGQDYINVKDYGAVLDGTTDDSAAFDQAYTLAPTDASIWVPRGAVHRATSLPARTPGSNVLWRLDGDTLDATDQTIIQLGDGDVTETFAGGVKTLRKVLVTEAASTVLRVEIDSSSTNAAGQNSALSIQNVLRYGAAGNMAAGISSGTRQYATDSIFEQLRGQIVDHTGSSPASDQADYIYEGIIIANCAESAATSYNPAAAGSRFPIFIHGGVLNVTTPWTATTAYVLNQIVTQLSDPFQNFICSGAGTSGSTEPTWNDSGPTTDGSVTWQPSSASVVNGWVPLTAYAVGHPTQPTPPNGFTYVCTIAGTSAASQPTWPVSAGTVSDGTVTWAFSGTVAMQMAGGFLVASLASAEFATALVATGPYYDAILELSGATLADGGVNDAAIRLAANMPIDFSGDLTAAHQNVRTLRYNSGNTALEYITGTHVALSIADTGVTNFPLTPTVAGVPISGGGGSVTSVVAGSGLAGGTITTAGTISLGTIVATSLLGNAGTVSAVPSAVAIGSGLSLAASGTLSATGGGSVTSVVAGTGLSGGTITASGTVALATRTASTLMGNPGTAAATPSDITIGSGLTLSTAGTLSSTGGGGSVTSVATSGAGISGGPITGSGTLTVEWNAGTVSALGGAMAINSGTISPQNQGTITLSGTTTGTINPSGVDSFLVNNGTAAGTIAVSPGFQGQRLRVEIKQGATAHTITFTSTVSFGTTVTSYTATNTASARDLIQLFCVDGTHWAFAAVSQGFTI